MPVSSTESGGSESTFETEEDEKENDEELDVALVNLKQRRGRCRPFVYIPDVRPKLPAGPNYTVNLVVR